MDVVNDCLDATIISLKAKLAAHEATIAAQKIIIGKHEACTAALRPHLKQMNELLAGRFSESEPDNAPNTLSPVAALGPGHQKTWIERSGTPAEPNESVQDPSSNAAFDHDDSLSFVVLECDSLRVHRASPRWLRFFGFRKGETEGRSLRICFGPGTDTDAINGLLHHAAAGGLYNGIWSKVVLYQNSGEEQPVLIQARALEPVDENDKDEIIKTRLTMRAVQSSAGLPTPPSVTISEDFHTMLDCNQVCNVVTRMFKPPKFPRSRYCLSCNASLLPVMQRIVTQFVSVP